MEKVSLGATAIAVIALVLGGAALSQTLAPQEPTVQPLQPTQRTIYMAAIEPKGSTTVDKEPFPTLALPAGKGYGLKEPDETGKWVVETYKWVPGTITVNQGDTVTLEIVGINGDEHPSIIQGYDIEFTLKRGEVRTVTFVADKPGIFNIVCTKHQPSMTAQLTVLPTGTL